MCQGSAAQALALLEALTDTNRRSLLSSVPVPADVADTELGDVYSELFMAAREIISGQFFYVICVSLCLSLLSPSSLCTLEFF